MMLSIPKQRLLITGAEGSGGDNSNNPLSTIQSEGFIITHCKKQADIVKKGRSSFSSTLKLLDKYAIKDDAKGEEAKIFAERMRKWIAKRDPEILKETQAKPAKTMAGLTAWLKLIKGLEYEEAGKARLKEVKAYKHITELTLAYKKYASIQKTIVSRGSSKTTDKSIASLQKQLERYLVKPGVDPILLPEAKAFLEEISK